MSDDRLRVIYARAARTAVDDPGDHVAGLRAVEAAVAAMAWDEGAGSRQCHCAAWSEASCVCGDYPSERNPYRAALGVPAGSEQEAEHG